MYEKEQKESFIAEYLRSKVVAETSLYAIFKKTEPFERKLGKDVSMFTRKEILSMLKDFKSKSVNSLLNYCIVLKHYSRWRNIENEYEGIVKSDVYDLVNKDAAILLTREDIEDIVAQLLNWSDKAIVWLLWEGIAGQSMKDLFSFSKENVNFNKKIIIVNGIEYPLANELVDILPKAFAENEIMSYGTTMRIVQVNGVGRIYKERANTRGIDSDDGKFRYIYRRIQLFRDYLDMPALTMKNISSSGLFYYLQLGMEERKLGMREFLKTKQGERLARRYSFGDYWVDNVSAKYEQYNN